MERGSWFMTVEFDSDGKIKWSEDLVLKKKEEPYIFVMKTIQELPFSVGKKLLIDVLLGNERNDSVKRNKLYELSHFGCLAYDEVEMNKVIETLEADGFIVSKKYGNNPWKVLSLTNKGENEVNHPKFYRSKQDYLRSPELEITEQDNILFQTFDFFLSNFNIEQKKAITSNNNCILCIAGAGSGKTTVLTKRIEFLVKYRSVESKKVLAITFTRKARKEMQERLAKLGHNEVVIETFNSFCEKFLRRNNDLVYNKTVRMMSYSDKMRLFKSALESLGISVSSAVELYFKKSQLKSKSIEDLFYILMNDCFFVVDYYKSKNREIEDLSLTSDNVAAAKFISAVCKYIDKKMRNEGLRDHIDQLVDTLNFLKKNNNFIPKFDYVLVDEYQDVNNLQTELIDLLNPKHLFCVGDPRQSIFGWRGSNINYILNFKEKYEGAELISLKKNYRSSSSIVGFMNEVIRPMALPSLESDKKGEKDVKLFNFRTESAEFEFVIQMILASDVPREEIFVLARMNKQLSALSKLMYERGINYVLKSDEQRKSVEAGEGQVTLATVHAIKGLEAKLVFVIGCTSLHFPCKASEHPIIDMIDIEEYDKEEEERRLFYVALSRAKDTLFMTYYGRRHSYFLSDKLKNSIGFKDPDYGDNKSIKEYL
ncbi:MAG: exodeoxyribonuclease V subunit gamma [Nanoarchaeota archaeon]|nr:exodeoxyribonuclease V subunit gamma [Nanoarchaeota archaeon]